MAGSLQLSPAKVLQRLIVNFGGGMLPTNGGADTWPIYVDQEPDLPDNCITIYNVVGRKDGRTMIDGEIMEHHGIQLRIRGALSDVTYTKARALAVLLDEEIYQEQFIIGSSVYCVHSFTRTTDVIPFGKDAPTPSKRSMYSINGLVDLRQKS